MKVNSMIILQLSKSEIELLNEIYTRTALKNISFRAFITRNKRINRKN